MQYKGQGYMMLKETICKTKRYHIKTYLALANVPMWHYGFKPCFLQIFPLHRQSIIHYPPFFRPLHLVLMLAFGPLNSPSLESNTKKEDISSTREGQIL